MQDSNNGTEQGVGSNPVDVPVAKKPTFSDFIGPEPDFDQVPEASRYTARTAYRLKNFIAARIDDPKNGLTWSVNNQLHVALMEQLAAEFFRQVVDPANIGDEKTDLIFGLTSALPTSMRNRSKNARDEVRAIADPSVRNDYPISEAIIIHEFDTFFQTHLRDKQVGQLGFLLTYAAEQISDALGFDEYSRQVAEVKLNAVKRIVESSPHQRVQEGYARFMGQLSKSQAAKTSSTSFAEFAKFTPVLPSKSP